MAHPNPEFYDLFELPPHLVVAPEQSQLHEMLELSIGATSMDPPEHTSSPRTIPVHEGVGADDGATDYEIFELPPRAIMTGSAVVAQTTQILESTPAVTPEPQLEIQTLPPATDVVDNQKIGLYDLKDGKDLPPPAIDTAQTIIYRIHEPNSDEAPNIDTPAEDTSEPGRPVEAGAEPPVEEAGGSPPIDIPPETPPPAAGEPEEPAEPAKPQPAELSETPKQLTEPELPESPKTAPPEKTEAVEPTVPEQTETAEPTELTESTEPTQDTAEPAEPTTRPKRSRLRAPSPLALQREISDERAKLGARLIARAEANGNLWGQKSDSPLEGDPQVSMEGSFQGTIPEGQGTFREYIETRMQDQPNKVAIEIGGPGSNLFAGFTPNTFETTIGLNLTDPRDSQRQAQDAVRGHQVITGDLTSDEVHTQLNQALGGQKAGLIIERMDEGHQLLPSHPVSVAEQAAFYYDKLAPGGDLFVELPPTLRPYVDDWKEMVTREYPGLEVQPQQRLFGFMMRITKGPGAPEKLPLLPVRRIYDPERYRNTDRGDQGSEETT